MAEANNKGIFNFNVSMSAVARNFKSELLKSCIGSAILKENFHMAAHNESETSLNVLADYIHRTYNEIKYY